MAAKKQPIHDFIPADELERQQQAQAGRVLMTMPEPEPEPPQYTEPDPDDIALQNVLAELGTSGSEAKVNVYQLDARQNRAFIGAFLPSEFSLEQVQAKFGPGDYEIRVYDAGRLATRKVIKIAAPKEPLNALSTVAAPIMETAKIIETMQSGFKEMGAMFANALAGLAANQPKPKTTLETLQELQMMRDIMGNNQPAPAVPDPMQLFEMANSIAEKITPRTGEPGTGEIILNAIKEFGPVISQAAANAANRPPAPLMPNPAPHIPAPIPAHIEPAIPATTPEHDQMNFARRMYLNLLITNAQANNDPSTYANLMLDVAGEQAALEFANDPQWFEKLCGEEPRAAEFRPWFEELRGMVLELTKPEIPGINEDSQQPPAP